jgi:putative membrane-bound dehydrogenase-like protein
MDSQRLPSGCVGEKGGRHLLPVTEGDTVPAEGRGLQTKGASHLYRRHLAAIVIWMSLAASAAAAEFAFDGLKLTAPDGFVVERIAGPPLVDRPVSVALDEEGRIYVADSSGSNMPLVQQQADPQHKVVRLEDTDGDGVFDRRTVFADKLMMLQGTLWHRGSLYVAAPPEIIKLTDTDGDGVADERTTWFKGTLTGCGNDVHGPYLGRDGWFYWCKGAFASQTHDLPGRPGWKSSAAHVFRARPDGSGREIVVTGGMDNPVDVGFMPTGERLVSATFIEPVAGRRDGVFHALYGGVYGKVHGVIEGHERTGDLLPVLIHMGPAAACGTQVHSGFSFGGGFARNLFVCGFNLRTVSRHVLLPAGASYTTVDTPFLVGDSPDFHPTDVFEDADGSLIVVDTGGWYKLCCPTSKLEKPAVLGAIYRVRRQDAPRIDDPRGRNIAWATRSPARLAALLADARPAVAERAADTLARIGAAAVPALAAVLADASAAATRQQALWTLARIEGAEARAAVRKGLDDASAEVRHTAVHVAGLHRDREAVRPLGRIASGPDPGGARAAAEALGRIGGDEAVAAVLAAVPRASDRALEHSLTYALIEAARPEPLLAAVDSRDPRVVRAALYGLDQMAPRLPSPAVPRDRVLALCDAVDPAVSEAAWWIASRHPDWVPALVGKLEAQLGRAAVAAPEEADTIVANLARLSVRPAAADAIAATYTTGGAGGGVEGKTSAAARRAALAVMRAARPATTPPSWLDALAAALRSEPDKASADDVAAALQTLASLPLSPEQRAAVRPAAVAIAMNPSSSPRTCAMALQVASSGGDGLPPQLVDRLLGILAAEDEAGVSPLDRSAAAAAVAAANLTDEQWRRIAATLERLPGNDAAVLLAPLTKKGGGLLVAAVEAIGRGARPEAIDRGVVASAIAALEPAHGDRGRELLARIDAARAAERESYTKLAAALPPGDASRGQAVFMSTKAACATCHAMGGVGGRIGPDLTKIGQIRGPHDLLEAIVLPSASFVRSYEPVTILTEDGRAFSGIIRDETAADIVLQTSVTATERIARASIESLQPGTVSLMPKGFDTLLSPQELADLVVYLGNSK